MLKCLCVVVTLLWRKIPAESVNWSTAECKHSLILKFTRQQLAGTMSKFSRHTTQAEQNMLSSKGTRLQYAVQALIWYCACILQWVVFFVEVDCEMFCIHICFAQSEYFCLVRRIVLGLCEASRGGIAKMQQSTIRDTTALTEHNVALIMNGSYSMQARDLLIYVFAMCLAFQPGILGPPRVYSTVQISLGVCTLHS